MTESDLRTIINQAIQGNEFPFNRFFEETFKKLQPRLESLTNSQDDIKDLYLMSMQKFWQRFVINNEKLPHNSIGYIYMMCKNAFLLKKREPWTSVILSENTDGYQKNLIIETSEKEEHNDSSNNELLKFNALAMGLETMCVKCKKLLETELDKEIRLKDLMEELGYSNYQALVQAKYNCKKRLIKKVKEVLSILKTEKLNIK